MNKHTPGPWYAGNIRTHGADSRMNGCDISAENGANVALALHQAGDRKVAETVANARLIAAAPDLLDALEMVRDADDDCYKDGLPTIPKPARLKIDAALAKARGQA